MKEQFWQNKSFFPFTIKIYISESTHIKALDLLTWTIDGRCPQLLYFDSAASMDTNSQLINTLQSVAN